MNGEKGISRFFFVLLFKKNLALGSVHLSIKIAEQIVIKCFLHKTIVLLKLCVEMNFVLLPILNFVFVASLGYYFLWLAEFSNYLWYCLPVVATWTLNHITFSGSYTNPDAFFRVWNHYSQILMNIFCQKTPF